MEESQKEESRITDGGGEETVVDLSSRPLTDEEFRLLGKGLKFCPKPKPHDSIKLAEETFKFSRSPTEIIFRS